MLRALPAAPLISLLFPGPAGQLLDLRQLEHDLDRAGQRRYCRLRLPWVPATASAAAAAPQLAVLQSSSGSWLSTLYEHSHGHVILVQHAVTGGDAYGGYAVPGCQAQAGVSQQEPPTGVAAAWQWRRHTYTAVVAEGPDGAPTCLVQQGILPALHQNEQGSLAENICWLKTASAPHLASGACTVAVHDAIGVAWLFSGGQLHALHMASMTWLRIPAQALWPRSEQWQPVAALVHHGQLMCVARDGRCGQRLQLWALDPHPWLEALVEAAAAEVAARAAAVASAGYDSEGAAEADAAIAAAAATRADAEANIDAGEPAGSAWRQVDGGAFELPGTVAGYDIAVAPNQVGRFVLVLQPQQAQQAQQQQQQQQQQALELGVPGASGSSAAANPEGGRASTADEPAEPAAGCSAAQPLVLTYDLQQQHWNGLQQPQLSEPCTSSSGWGGSGGRVWDMNKRQHQVPRIGPWWLLGNANPSIAGSKFFVSESPDASRKRGAAGWAAAKAGAAAMEAAPVSEPGAESSAAAAVLRQQRQAVALAVDGPDSMVAVWQDWQLPQAPRLGEIAWPEGLPYDLRQAQVVRALAAGETCIAGAAGPAGAAGAAGTATAEGDVAAGSSSGATGSSSSGSIGTAAVLLRIAADPSLSPIFCPMAAAAQCGELCRLLEVLEEGEEQLLSQQQQQQRELLLVGVAPEEHAALQQLVGCLAGRTHAGLLESTLLLDVARLADLLDASALLSECLATLCCVVPGPETFAPLLALAEGRQYHAELQRLKLFYAHALALHILEGRQPLLAWALHGLRAGVDTILEVCTEVAARWLPLQPELYLGSPAGDLEALSSADWHAAAQQHPAKLRPLLVVLLPLWRRQLEDAEVAPSGPQPKRSKTAAAGPFQSAAVRPPPPKPASLSDAALQQEVRRLLQQLQRALPSQRKREREARTAAAFEQSNGGSGGSSGGGWAAAEARARRHRQPA